MRRRHVNNVLDDRVPNEVEYPFLSPSTPLARNPPHIPDRSLPNEVTPINYPQSLSSPAALPIPDLATFATDVDYTASSLDVTPLAQTASLQSNVTSPQLSAASPFSDAFELTQSQLSEVVRADSGSDDDDFSVPSSVSSITATDDEDDNDSLGSGESWHDIRNELNRF